jgi:hypothetical protein
MLGALLVELVFFIHYIILKPATDTKMTQQDTSSVKGLEKRNLQIKQKQSPVKSAEIE